MSNEGESDQIAMAIHGDHDGSVYLAEHAESGAVCVTTETANGALLRVGMLDTTDRHGIIMQHVAKVSSVTPLDFGSQRDWEFIPWHAITSVYAVTAKTSEAWHQLIWPIID